MAWLAIIPNYASPITASRREYWLDIKEQGLLVSNFFKECRSAEEMHRLDLSLKVDESLSLEKNIAMWSQFDCLRIDYDLLAMAYPTLQETLGAKIDELKRIRQKIVAVARALSFKDPQYNITTAAETALYHLVSYILNPKYEDIMLKKGDYRKGLLTGNWPKPFDKKIYAGHDEAIKKPFVLITHATTVFDDKTIKTFADKTIRRAKEKNLPVVYLSSEDGRHDQTWYLEDRRPDRVYYSKNGEHSLLFDSNTVIMMGGNFTQCLRVSQLDTITRHFLNSEAPLTIHLPVSGIYLYDREQIIDFRKISKKTFLARVKDGSLLGGYEVDDDHGGMVESDMNKLTGIPDLKMYTVKIYTDGQLLHTSGDGPRVVNLQFWSDKAFEKMLESL